MVSVPYAAGMTGRRFQMIASVPSNAALPAPRVVRGQTFDEVRSDVSTRADLAFPDAVIPLSRLSMTDEGLLDVPLRGALAMTPWSRQQLARMLGIRWQRWFDGNLVSPEEQAEEIDRRLQRSTGEWKIRARRYAPNEEVEGDGVLRAFVGAGYTPIDDERVFNRLGRVLGPRTETLRFARAEITDRGSYYVAVNADDVDLGNGIPDLHRMGWHLVNSEVGAAALRIFEYVLRLVCTNGLVMRVAQELFSRVHRATQDESIDRDLAYAMTLLPERWEASTRALRAARHDRVIDPEESLRHLFADRAEVRSHADAVLAAYREEPEPTRFGLVQAITRAAQAAGAEHRLALEALAGEIVTMALPSTTPPATPVLMLRPPAALPTAPRVAETGA